MCGVPYHSAEGYIGRLVAKGYKVAICEQMEDPALAKGLVRREIIRKISPGTVLESSMLDESRNNFIAAVYRDSRGAGMCFCDISTGEMTGTQALGPDPVADIENELGRFSPRELLLSDGAYSDEGLRTFARDRLGSCVEQGGEWRFVEESAREAAEKQFPQQTFAPEEELLVRAAGGLLSYLHETQKSELSYISRLEVYGQSQYMELDYTARRNLELTASLHGGEKKGSLLWVLDKTRTAMGARLLRQWLEKPLLSVAAIERRQEAVAALAGDLMARESLEQALSGVNDMERIASRIVYGSANGRDLRALWTVCQKLPDIRAGLEPFRAPLLRELLDKMDPLTDVGELIGSAIVDEPPFSLREGGIIRPGFDPRADELRELLGGGSARLARIEQQERERTGIPKLKVGYNKVFGYYIEVSRSYSGQVPEDYIRKQTLAGCERYITPELKALEGEVLSASDRLTALEYQLFTGVREKIAAQVERLQAVSQAVGGGRFVLPGPGGGAEPLCPPHGGRFRPDRHPGRAAPGGGAGAGGRSLRPQRHLPQLRGRPGVHHHRPEYGGQIHLYAPGGAHLHYGPVRELCPRGERPHRRVRPGVHPGGGVGRSLCRALHLHGGDERGGGDPAPRDKAEPAHSR